jgi:hypothetical protein
MEVKINDNWTIEPDNYGYILRQYHINRKKSKDGTPTKNHGKWVVKSTVYPSTIKSAVRCVLEKEAGANINHLQEFEDRIKDVEKNLTELIKQQKL